MIRSIVPILILFAYAYGDDFCSPQTTVASNYTFPPSASSPQPYSGTLKCTWTINVPDGHFVEVTVAGQLSSGDLFQLSSDGTDHKRTFSSSGEGLKPSGLFRLPSGSNKITLQTVASGSLYFQVVFKPVHVYGVQYLSVSPNRTGSTFNFYDFELIAVYIEADNPTDPGVAISITDYPASTEDLDSFFIFSGYDCYNGTFLATLRDVLMKMPSISVFSGNITVCPTVELSTDHNLLLAQDKSAMKGLDKYYIYDMRTQYKSISLMSNPQDKNMKSAVTFYDYYYSQSLHAYNLKTNSIISFTDSTAEKAPTEQILPSQTEFYSQNNPQDTFYTLFFSPNAEYSMDVDFVYTIPKCSQDFTQLSISNISYTFPGSSSSVNESMYFGTYNCMWKVDVSAGYYAKVFVDINLGMNDSFQVSHENGFQRSFKSNAGTNGPIFDGILYLPAGSSEIHFSATNRGFIKFSVEWDPIPSKPATQVSVAKSQTSSNILWSDLMKNDYMITASDKLNINLASASLNGMDVQVLDACFVYQNGPQDPMTLMLLSQAFDTSRSVSKTAYVSCVTPIFIPGSLLTQSQENVKQYGSYRARTTYGSMTFDLNVKLGYDAITVMDIDSSKMLTLKMLSTTTNPLDIIDGTPEKPVMKTTNVVPPEVQTSSTTTYVLKSGSASIVVDDGVQPTSAPVNQFCTPSITINIHTGNYSFPSGNTSFDAANDCMWKFNVQINRVGIINIRSTLQKTDTLVVTNVETGLTRQLDSKSMGMNNTFYFPVGTNIIHLKSQFNGTLSFSVIQNYIPNGGLLSYPVVKGNEATVVELDRFTRSGAYIYNTNSSSLSFTISEPTNAEDTMMMDSVFVFSGRGCDQQFVATLGDFYRSPVSYKYQALSLCPTVLYEFSEVMIVQDAEVTSSYASYAAFNFDDSPGSRSFMLDGTKGKAGISYYFYNTFYHLSVSDLKGGNLSVINSSPGFPAYTTISPSVGPQPFVSLPVDSGLVTLTVDKGTTATFVAGTMYVASACDQLTKVDNYNGSYAYPYGAPSSPAFYAGVYNCEWDVFVKKDTYALVTVTGQLGAGDYFKVVHVDGTEEMINDPNKVQNISYYQPHGLSKLYFNATSRGTIAFNIKFYESGQQNSTNMTIAAKAPAQAIDLMSLNTKTYRFSPSTDNGMLSFSTALLSGSNSTDLSSCLVVQESTQKVMFTLSDLLNSAMTVSGVSTMYCGRYLQTPGYVLVQDQANLNGVTIYKSSSINGTASFDLRTVGTAITIVGYNIGNTTISTSTQITNGLLEVKAGGPESMSIANVSTVSNPITTTSFLTTYKLTKGQATIVVTGSKVVTTTTTKMMTTTKRPVTTKPSTNTTTSGTPSGNMTTRPTQAPASPTSMGSSSTSTSTSTMTSSHPTSASTPTSIMCQPKNNVTMDEGVIFIFPSGSPNYYASGQPISCSWNVIVRNGFFAGVSFTGDLPDSDIVTFNHDSMMEKLSGKFAGKQFTVPSGSSVIAINFSGNGSFSFQVNYIQEQTKKSINMTVATQQAVDSMDLSSLKSQSLRIVKAPAVKTMSLAVAVRNMSSSLSNCFVTRDDGFLLFRLSDATSLAQFVTDTVNINCVTPSNDLSGSILVQDTTGFPSTFYTVAYASHTTCLNMSSLVMPEMLTLIADDDKNVVLSGMNMTGNGVIMVSDGTPNTKSSLNLTSSKQIPYVSTSKYTTFTLTQGTAALLFSTETKASATQLLTTVFVFLVVKYL